MPELTLVEPIVSGWRTDLWRVTDGDRFLVVKAYRDPDRGTWRREAAGLRLAQGEGAPALVGVSTDPTLVVMEDLGRGASLADLLLGLDRGAAQRGLAQWAAALAHVHRRTIGRREQYDDALRADGATGPVGSLVDEIGRGMTELAETTAAQGLPAPDGVPATVLSLVEPLLDPATHVLSPGDTCPDNNHLDGDRLRLIDFEFSEFRHPAWDVAYLRVPFPSCWCAWAIPAAAAREGEAAYLAAGGPAGPDWEASLAVATLAWCLVSTGWFIRATFAGEGDRGTDRRPGRRAMILNRLRLASISIVDPGLAAYAHDLAEALTARWGEHPLAWAPAFR